MCAGRTASLTWMDSICAAEHHGQSVNWAHPTSNSTHPPHISPHGFSMFSSSSFLETDGGFRIPLSLPIQGGAHRRSPAGHIPQVSSAWLSDRLSSPDGEVVLKKCSHRRSASDSVAFVDSSYQFMSYLENVTEEDEFIRQETALSTCMPNHRRGLSAGNDSNHHGLQCKLPATPRSYPEKVARGAQSSRRENFVKIGGVESYHRQHRHENLAACNREGFNFAKSGSLEVSWNAEKDKKHVTLAISSSKSDCWLASRDSDQVDPKTAQRILANRQSDQRSRVRKLHYISELESNVGKIEAEVASLSPKIRYHEHERVLLNVENVILKQKLAALTKAQRLKEALNESLKSEVQRLRQMFNQEQPPALQYPQQRPLFLDVLDLQFLEFSKLDLGPPTTKPKLPSVFEGVRGSSNRPSLYSTKVISFIHAQDNNNADSPSSHAAKGLALPSCMAPGGKAYGGGLMADASTSSLVNNS
uniref:BZIP domain-containing protein n=1 Tax=Physcomitrium patens TaxID=3218 RepID=A0A2K1KCS6_PHYPA|nr:hypothetical protein PHYPA_010748 [Physcomitrium patens]